MVFAVGGGFLGLIIGAHMLVTGSIQIARSIGISEVIIGLTLVALSTSLPELAISIVAAVRKHSDVVIGNVLGSNIFNILSVLGFSAMVSPIPFKVEMIHNVWFMAGVALILFLLLVLGKKITRPVGIFFLFCYGGYISWLYGYVP